MTVSLDRLVYVNRVGIGSTKVSGTNKEPWTTATLNHGQTIQPLQIALCHTNFEALQSRHQRLFCQDSCVFQASNLIRMLDNPCFRKERRGRDQPIIAMDR